MGNGWANVWVPNRASSIWCQQGCGDVMFWDGFIRNELVEPLKV